MGRKGRGTTSDPTVTLCAREKREVLGEGRRTQTVGTRSNDIVLIPSAVCILFCKGSAFFSRLDERRGAEEREQAEGEKE